MNSAIRTYVSTYSELSNTYVQWTQQCVCTYVNSAIRTYVCTYSELSNTYVQWTQQCVCTYVRTVNSAIRTYICELSNTYVRMWTQQYIYVRQYNLKPKLKVWLWFQLLCAYAYAMIFFMRGVLFACTCRQEFPLVVLLRCFRVCIPQSCLGQMPWWRLHCKYVCMFSRCYLRVYVLVHYMCSVGCYIFLCGLDTLLLGHVR